MGTLGEALLRTIVFGGIAAIVGWIMGAAMEWATGLDDFIRMSVVMSGMIGAIVGFFSAFMGDDDDD